MRRPLLPWIDGAERRKIHWRWCRICGMCRRVATQWFMLPAATGWRWKGRHCTGMKDIGGVEGVGLRGHGIRNRSHRKAESGCICIFKFPGRHIAICLLLRNETAGTALRDTVHMPNLQARCVLELGSMNPCNMCLDCNREQGTRNATTEQRTLVQPKRVQTGSLSPSSDQSMLAAVQHDQFVEPFITVMVCEGVMLICRGLGSTSPRGGHQGQ
jgi:hypothetical protein